MNYRVIDMENYIRRDHFEHFLTMEDPFVELTVQLDITDWFRTIKELNQPFFLSFLYQVGRSANSVRELRQRIRDHGIIEYENCACSYTVALADGTYRYANVGTDLPFSQFVERAQQKQQRAKEEEHLIEEGDPESYFYISCLPWCTYSGIRLPAPEPCFSVPSVTWGKYYREQKLRAENGQLWADERIMIPVTLQANHALVDGVHMSRFFSALEENLKAFAAAHPK